MHHDAHAALPQPPRVDRVALLSVHTCPLDQPGSGDAGGMNVYLREVAVRLAEMGVAVDIFTRDPGCPEPIAEFAPGARAIHLTAGPRSVINKEAVVAQLDPFTYALAAFAERDSVSYDLVHAHYWMGGKVGRLLAERWRVPFLQTFHTLAKVKNLALAAGDRPEPADRIATEERIVSAADQILAPTVAEADELVTLYRADPARVRVVSPGVDPDRFSPGDGTEMRAELGIPPGRPVILFVGRLQPLKAPEVAVRAVAEISIAGKYRPVLVVVGGPSGILGTDPDDLRELAASCGMDQHDLRFLAPATHDRLAQIYRAATITIVPSRTESFGLVALESAASGTPVVASDVGGLRTTVRDGETGTLVPAGDHHAFARAITALLDDRDLAQRYAERSTRFARRFDWRWVARGLLSAYEDAVYAGARASRFASRQTGAASEER